MGNKFFDAIGGIVSVKLSGKRPEKIINMALSRGVYLWDIKRNRDSMDFKIRTSGYQALKNLADENAYDLKVISKKGLPFMRGTIKRRLGFLGGGILFILALYIMTSFIWFIDVTGNEKLDRSRILLTASKYGVYKGAAKWNFSRSEVEAAMLREINELSYVKLDVQGVKCNIEVVEKILPGEEITGPCHIVAVRDAIIEEVLVLDGQAKVKAGDVVGKGDILISGIVFPEPNPYIVTEPEENPLPSVVRARGTVQARVWYEGYGECPLRDQKIAFTGNSKRVVYFKTPWKEFKLYGNRDCSYPKYQEKLEKNTIKTPVGELGFYTMVKMEQETEVIEYDEKEAASLAKQKALENLKKETGSSPEIVDSRVQILSAPSESILRIKVAVETIENIAVARPIEGGENSN